MNARNNKGFTLVEIMIVVVIIGLLAALAIPAFHKVRNNALEKTLMNDARQLSSAANQFMSENGFTGVTLTDIQKFIASEHLSSGVVFGASAATATEPATLAANSTLSGITTALGKGEYFSLGHVNYSSALSSKAEVISACAAANQTWISFSVDTGYPAR